LGLLIYPFPSILFDFLEMFFHFFRELSWGPIMEAARDLSVEIWQVGRWRASTGMLYGWKMWCWNAEGWILGGYYSEIRGLEDGKGITA
jgi:hypothetical protein